MQALAKDINDLTADDVQVEEHWAQQAGNRGKTAATEAVHCGRPTLVQAALYDKHQGPNIRARRDHIKRLAEKGVFEVDALDGVLCKCSNPNCEYADRRHPNPLICNTKVKSEHVPDSGERMKVTFPPSHPKHGGESWEYAQIERVVEELGVNQSHLSTSTKDGPWEPSKGKFKGHTFERLGRPEYPEDMWLTFPCPACERKLLPLEVPQEGGDDYTSLNFYALAKDDSLK